MARTVTISDEAAAAVEAEAVRTKRSVDELVDEALQREFTRGSKAPATPFKVNARSMGVPMIDIECTGRALEELDAMERE